MWQIFLDGNLVASCSDGEFVETVGQIRQRDGELTVRWMPGEVDTLISALNLLATDGENVARQLQRYTTDTGSEFDYDECIKWLEMLRDDEEI